VPYTNYFYQPPVDEIQRHEMLCQTYEEIMQSMLLGGTIYEIDPDDPIGAYQEVREQLKLEDLPMEKQQVYADYKEKLMTKHKKLATLYLQKAMTTQSVDHLFSVLLLGDDSILHNDFPQIKADCDQNFYLAMALLLNGQAPQYSRELLVQIPKSDKENYGKARFMLGLIYHYGLGIESNDSKARKHFKVAKQKGIDVSEYYSPTPSCFSSCLLS